MPKKSRAGLVFAAVVLLMLGVVAALVVNDLRDGLALQEAVEARARARKVELVAVPALRLPAEDCDGLQRQLDLFRKVAPPNLSHDVEASFDPKTPLTSATYAFLADRENGFDSMLDASRCTSTRLERLEIGREFRPSFTLLKLWLWRAEIQKMPTLEPAACVKWCNEVIRATLDDSPGEGAISEWQDHAIPMVTARLSECAVVVDPAAATNAAADLARLMAAWPPFSKQIDGMIDEAGADLSYFYVAGHETKWPFHGVRAHLQLRAVLRDLHALLARPESWKSVDSGSYSTRLHALDSELSSRDLRPVPFADVYLVSPGWDIAVGTTGSMKDLLEARLRQYTNVQTRLRLAYAALVAPSGNITDHAADLKVQDPYAEHDPLRWSPAKHAYYSVGPNGSDDGGADDDLLADIQTPAH